MSKREYKVEFTIGGKTERSDLHRPLKNGDKIVIESKPNSIEKGELEIIKITSDASKTVEEKLVYKATKSIRYEIDYSASIAKKISAFVSASDKTRKKEVPKDNESRLRFARVDYDLVHRETIDIKTCRTHLFVVMLSVIGAIGVSLLGIYKKESLSEWLLPASFIPLLLLTVAIYATIHKARGLNKRLGYLEAVGSYIEQNKLPNCWSGWLNATRVSERCRCLREKYKTEQAKCYCIEKEGVEEKCYIQKKCEKQAKKDAKYISNHLSWKPDFLNSFTSFSGHCYMVAYILTILFILYSVCYSLVKVYGIVMWSDLWGPMIVAVCGGIITLTARFNIRKKKHYNFTIAIALILISPLITFCISSFFNKSSLNVYLTYGISVICFSSACYFACNIYDHIKRIGVGCYSIERYYYLWTHRLKSCPLMALEKETYIEKLKI